MKNAIRALAACAALALAACGAATETATADAGTEPADAAVAQPVLTELTPAELHAALEHKDFVMIDVHVPYAGVVSGTDKSIPYTDVNAIAEYIGDDLDRKVVLTCLGDPMSRSAGNALVARGYRAVGHLKGGMNAWVAAGYTLQH